jgi:hypothetical protein
MSTPNSDLDSTLDAFSAILQNDPGPLEPSSDYYVRNLHGDPARDLIFRMQRTLTLQGRDDLFYFSGQRGTGKSTELRRLVHALNSGPDCRAYIVDASDYISDTHAIDLADLLLVVLLAFADCLNQEFEHDFLDEPLVARFTNWLHTEVQLTGVTVAGVKADFRSKQKTVINRLRDFEIDRAERFVQECREFAALLAAAVKRRHRVAKVVLVVDSLERLRGVGAQATDMFDRVVKVFDGGLDALRLPGLLTVYSVPPYLANLANLGNRTKVFQMASVAVCRCPRGALRRQAREEGLAALRELVTRRFERWPVVLRPEALDRLALVSGGDIRQLLRRLLQYVVDEAFFAQERLPLGADDSILDAVIERHQVELEQLVARDEYAFLADIGERNRIALPSGSALIAAARLLDIRAVMNYREEAEWVDINPLLWPLIDAWREGRSEDGAHHAS